MNINIIPGYCDGWARKGHSYDGDDMRSIRRLDIQLCPDCYADYCADNPPRALVIEGKRKERDDDTPQ